MVFTLNTLSNSKRSRRLNDAWREGLILEILWCFCAKVLQMVYLLFKGNVRVLCDLCDKFTPKTFHIAVAIF